MDEWVALYVKLLILSPKLLDSADAAKKGQDISKLL